MRRLIGLLVAMSVATTVPAPAAGGSATDGSRSAGVRAAERRVVLPAPVPCRGCWHPVLRVSWQWQLQEPPRIGDLLDVRMYDVDGSDASRDLVRAMHRRGIVAVCYLDAGSWERWRADADRFPRAILGKPNGWPGERWLDIRRLTVLRPIMRARIDRCQAKGFDAVEFDLVDGYQADTGFPLTANDQLRYNVFLANVAHRAGMSALLKNDLAQIPRLLPYFDAALNEQCHQYRECHRLTPFIDAGKPVFGVEYALGATDFCPAANARNFNFLQKHRSLGPWRRACRGRESHARS
jgi:hypothetical protein